MKSLIALFALGGFILLCGCQNFRYHDPQKPHRGTDRFYNNYNNDPTPSFWKWQWERWTAQKPVEETFAPEVLKTDTTFLNNNTHVNTLTWIGHSSVLLQVDGKNILLDPVFSERVSPFSFMGPRRLVALPFELKDLPSIDVVLISHNHYDHLDLKTLQALASREGNQTQFLVPLGTAELLQTQGISSVREYDWWDEEKIGGLKMIFTPAQHWTTRSLWDRNKSLWGGWAILGKDLKILYTGDTGYSKDFQDIRARLGSFDIGLIPIGAYEPRWFMKNQHVNPEEALLIHQDIGAKTSVALHWGTFRLADEDMLAPPRDLRKALKEHQLTEKDFQILQHGQVLSPLGL